MPYPDRFDHDVIKNANDEIRTVQCLTTKLSLNNEVTRFSDKIAKL